MIERSNAGDANRLTRVWHVAALPGVRVCVCVPVTCASLSSLLREGARVWSARCVCDLRRVYELSTSNAQSIETRDAGYLSHISIYQLITLIPLLHLREVRARLGKEGLAHTGLAQRRGQARLAQLAPRLVGVLQEGAALPEGSKRGGSASSGGRAAARPTMG